MVRSRDHDGLDILIVKHPSEIAIARGFRIRHVLQPFLQARLVGGAIILLLRFNRGKQIVASIILAIEAALVSYSRVYVGVHYPLDVFAGILLGTGIACAVVASSKYMGPIFSRIDSMKR